jgi:hypothetical protein
MAGQDELIYRVVYESDETSFKAVQTQLNALTQQTAQAVQKAQVQALKSGAGVQGLKEIEGIVKGAQAGTAGLVSLAKQIQATKDELTALGKTAKENKGLNDDQIKQQVDLKTKLSVLSGEYRRAERDLISLSSAGQDVANTYNELVKKNAALSAEIRNLPLSDTTGKLKSLKEEYVANNKVLKDFDSEMGNHQRNVGDYKNQILEASKSLSIFGVNMADVSKQFKQGKDSAGQGAGGINTMKASFQGLNTVMKANAIMLAVTAVIALAKAFMAAEPIMDRIKSIVATLEGAFSGLIKSLTSGGNWFKNISEGVKASQAINELTKANYTAETKLIESRADSIKQMAELTLLAKDESKTVAQRLKAVGEFEILNQKIADQERDLALKRVEAAQQGVTLNKESRESFRELAEARAQLAQADTDAVNRSKENQEKINALQRKQIENNRAISQEKIAQMNIEKSLMLSVDDVYLKGIEAQKQINQSLFDENKRLIETERVTRVQAINDEVLDAELKAQKIKTINQQAYADQTILLTEFEQKKVDLARSSEEQKLAFVKQAADSTIAVTSGLEALGFISAKKAFLINKAAGIAGATVDGYRAVVNTLATVPIPFKFPMAALVGAAAFGNVAKIAATQFNSGGGSDNAGSVASSVPSGGGMSAGLSINNVSANAIGASVTPITPNAAPTIIVNNTVDRAGIATLVREGNEEISARGLTVASV